MGDSPKPATYNPDLEHLRLLTLFHKIIAGIYGFFGFCGFPHFTIGIVSMTNPSAFKSNAGQGPDAMFSWMFLAAGMSVICFGWTLAVLNWLTANRLAQRRGVNLILVTEGLNCIWMPMGTALGAFGFVVMTRPSVRALFS